MGMKGMDYNIKKTKDYLPKDHIKEILNYKTHTN